VENRGGGNIDAEFVAKSKPNGYTLLIGGVPHAMGMSFFNKLAYDFGRDVAPVDNLAVFPSVISYAALHRTGCALQVAAGIGELFARGY
jgi:tripartite-type tricarboxylate transporter receptor subunit TctC